MFNHSLMFLAMCGIIGYIGKNDTAQVIIEGLKRMEYRGYDSAGLLIASKSASWTVIKKPGRVEILAKAIHQKNPKGSFGMGHTRWATHGGVNEVNTHPHVSADGKIAVTHNGVIENYAHIKSVLQKHGYTFQSETDTEVLANLIAYKYSKLHTEDVRGRFTESVRQALLEVQGSYGIAVMCLDCPNEIVGARKSSPLIVGVGQNEMFLASDVSAFAGHTKNAIYLSDNEIVHLSEDGYKIQDLGNTTVEAVVEKIDWDTDFAELGNYTSYMEKEIFEQPVTIENTMRGRFSKDDSTAHFGGLRMTAQELRQFDRLLFLACGTAWHACLVAKYLIERYARMPVEVEHASEFRYRNSPLQKNTLVFVVSQSGETLDSLSALQEAQRRGFRTLAISNIAGSSIARESDGGIYQRSGPEIGVASTKAFTGQICVAAMLALYFARLHDMSFLEGVRFVEALKSLPEQLEKVLKLNDRICSIAGKYAKYNNFLFLGRQSMFPIALEGALKLKEISYVHAEGYPAAELKHGPIALIDENCPSVFLAADTEVFKKTVSNMMEVKARKGPVIGIGIEGTDFPENACDDAIFIPAAHNAVLPIIATLPLQLLAYHTARIRKLDVDKPRNLAKSVTVE